MHDQPPQLPRATYRLQLTPEFGFDSACGVLPYLARLGVSHVYLSPCLLARDGSQHGYDGVDPTRLDTARGGEAAFERLLAGARAAGLGVVVDVVPNHLAASEQNPWWHDVLANGPESPFAHHFDIDWHVDDEELRGRVLLPILGRPLPHAVDDGAVRAGITPGGTPCLLVHDRSLPLSPASVAAGLHRAGDVHALLAAQHYVLEFWRDGLTRLNWRRFFDVTELVGVRVERDEVFDDMHRRLLQYVADGRVQGLRIDHPDGLRDPAGYARRLRAAAPSAWIVVEKILATDEALPADWPVHGTTGYDFLANASGLFVDPRANRPLAELCREFTGRCQPFAELRRDKERLALRELFPAEMARITAIAARALGPGAPPDARLRAVVEALVVAMPIYRTYVPERGTASAQDRRWLDAALVEAASVAMDMAEANALRRLHALATGDETGGDAGAEWRARLQQLTGPVVAKGHEDTALYCDRRLVCLNEVGSDPGLFGSSRREFFGLCERLHASWPATMTTLSTHDTKRSADVRMRIATLGECVEEWGSAVRRWRQRAARHRAAPSLPLPGAEYLLYQTLIGCWPAAPERVVGYMQKAAREAKLRTSWLDPDPDYERALTTFVRSVLDDRELLEDVEAFVARLLPAAHVHGLSLQLLQLTAVGVPDVYQGCEAWSESLTDPDNRRPVDFAALAAQLEHTTPLGPAAALAGDIGVAKQWLVHRVLGLRRDRPQAFGADAPPERLAVSGPDERCAVAFARGGEIAVVAPRFVLATGGRPATLDFTVALPAGRWRSGWDGAPVGVRPNAAELFEHFPVALLVSG
ncbi:MAG: malto-oligosyltrehalose synthase [Planctomycetes bacterium]|nr:malto-oligosyltrehalose synthase [Planctomycetota bacterium]